MINGVHKYYRCGMVSLLFIPLMFWIYLKHSSIFTPKYGIEIKYMNDSEWLNNKLYVFDDSSFVCNTVTILLDTIDCKKADQLLNIRKGNSLVLKIGDISYAKFIYFYNQALKAKLSIYNINNSSFRIFDSTYKRPIKRVIDFSCFLGPDCFLPITHVSILKRIIGEIRVFYLINVKFPLIRLYEGGILIRVFIVSFLYLIIVVLNIIELNRLLIIRRSYGRHDPE